MEFFIVLFSFNCLKVMFSSKKLCNTTVYSTVKLKRTIISQIHVDYLQPLRELYIKFLIYTQIIKKLYATVLHWFINAIIAINAINTI